MAGAPTDRIPLHTILLPVLGVAAWLLVGKAGLGLLALVLAVVLLGNVIAAVHHAEVVALRVGEPYGTLVLALAVTVIEAGLIISLMLGGDPNPALMRDSVHAAVMLVLHGLAGLCIVVAAIRHRRREFRVEGANAFLAVLIPMAVLVLVVPNHVVSAPGPYLVAAAAGLRLGGLPRAVRRLPVHPDQLAPRLLPAGGRRRAGRTCARRPARLALASFALMAVALLAVVVLAKALAPGAAGGRAGGWARRSRSWASSSPPSCCCPRRRRRCARPRRRTACNRASTWRSAARSPASG